jgi:hypothetical protein
MDADTQRLLLADYLLENETEEQEKERKNRQQRRIIDKARKTQELKYGQKNKS